MRVLAYGDSLTAGYCRMGTAFKPWAGVLRSELNLDGVDHIGLSGWTTGEMRRSIAAAQTEDVCDREWPGLRAQLESAKKEGKPRREYGPHAEKEQSVKIKWKIKDFQW